MVQGRIDGVCSDCVGTGGLNVWNISFAGGSIGERVNVRSLGRMSAEHTRCRNGNALTLLDIVPLPP